MKKVILLFICLIFNSFADLVGVGIGETEILAKKSALDELSQKIEVNVDSLFYTEETFNGDGYTRNSAGVINLLSNNFLIGVDYEIEKIGKNYSAVAKITDDKIYFYEQKIYDSYSSSSLYYNKGKESQSVGEKKSYFLGSLKELKKGNSYKNIAMLLGLKKDIKAPVSELEINDYLKKIKDSGLDKIILYIASDEESDGSIKNLLSKDLMKISRENNLGLMMGDKDYNNTTLILKVSSLEKEEIPPFYYNGKKLSDTIYKTNLVLSLVLKDSLSGKIYDSFTIDSSSKSFLSFEDSVNIATNRALRDNKDKISLLLQNVY